MAPQSQTVDRIPVNPSIGDRVYISSTGQSGTLRYWGNTAFRDGLWAGIELDDETGKNDGTVQG